MYATGAQHSCADRGSNEHRVVGGPGPSLADQQTGQVTTSRATATPGLPPREIYCLSNEVRIHHLHVGDVAVHPGDLTILNGHGGHEVLV